MQMDPAKAGLLMRGVRSLFKLAIILKAWEM